MTTTFPVGKRVRVTATFSDAVNKRFDPKSIVVSVSHNGRTEKLVDEVQRLEVGRFFVEVLFDDPGTWEVKFESTANGEESFEIQRYLARYNAEAQAPSVLFEATGDPAMLTDEQMQDIERADRAWMLERLIEAGVTVAEDRSDAYVRGVFRRTFDTDKPRAHPAEVPEPPEAIDEEDAHEDAFAVERRRLKIPQYESSRDRYLRRQAMAHERPPRPPKMD